MNKKPSHSILIITIILLGLTIATGAFFFITHHPDPETATTEPTPLVPGNNKPYNFDYSWADKSPYIAHAFGAINGQTYTNSLEAFYLNYQLGHRIFEVDFSLTDDHHTVLAHDAEHWRTSAVVKLTGDLTIPDVDTSVFSYDNFMSSLWFDQYHPLDLVQLFHLMQAYPDIYIVTDSKYFDEPNVRLQFEEIVATARSIDINLLDRLIVQIYNPAMLDYIMDIYPWKSVIYTLYTVWDTWTPENVLAFAEESGVKYITMWGDWITNDIVELWLPKGLQISAHTINYLSTIKELKALGVIHFYTDFLLP